MNSDLFGKQMGQRPEYVLDLQQKRQATLLYHWMSLDYLRGLKALIDALIKGADINLELAKQQGRDALIANDRWGVRDTSANWSTHVFPALEDFRKSTLRLIAWRVSEAYCGTGATQCAHMIDEFSSVWMTEEEEQRFKTQFKAIYSYASHIDFAAGVGGRRHQLHDFSMSNRWEEFSPLFPNLPKFRVRTDVEGVSGKRPPRTGVYVAQDDSYATLQFAWTGNADGNLGDAQTLNDVGRRAMSFIGRDSMWKNKEKMVTYVADSFKRGELTERGGFDPGAEADPDLAGTILSINSRTSSPCKWYYVERVKGEFEDEHTDLAAAQTSTQSVRSRIEANQPCPRTGYWFTPARENSRTHFEAGQSMPDVGGSWGTTIWQWDEQQ